jgi:hypothetical protein
MKNEECAVPVEVAGSCFSVVISSCRLLFLFFVILIQPVSAQEFNAGLRVGIDGSQVNGDRLSGFNKVGMIAGAFVSRKVSEKISFQMEMIFIQKGSRRPTDDFNTFYRLRVHYIEVPLLVQYHTSKKFALYAGPSYGALVFSAEDDQFGVYKNRPPFKKYEFAGNAGLLYSLSDRWTFDGRYSHSISTIRPYPGGLTTFFDQGQYNVVIEFTLLYAF